MLCALVACFLPPTIWIVDAASGPGTNFTDLPPAVAAAQDGDTILVRAGSYSATTITGKALVIRGSGAASTQVASLVAGNVPASGHLLIAGMRASSGIGITGPARVVLLDCRAWGVSGQTAGSALVVDGGALVHATRCELTGGNLTSSGGSLVPAGHGAWVTTNSRLIATACTFRGGSASASTSSWPTSGGSGVLVFGADVELAASDCFGGDGNAANLSNAIGGSGVLVSNGNGGTARVVGPAVLRGGVGHYFGPLAGNCGPAVRVAAGSAVVHGGVTLLPAMAGATLVMGAVTMNPATMPRLTVQSTSLPSGETNALQPLTMTFDAQLPNAPYAFVVGFEPAFAAPFGPLVLGPLLVDLASAGLATGTLDAQGRFSFSLVPAGVLGSALGIPLFSQAAAFDAATLQFRASNVDERIFAQ
jgi:hypothetical protein